MILAIGNRAGHFGGEREQGTLNREQTCPGLGW